MHFEWVKFRFDPVGEVTEAHYTTARERPKELWMSAHAQIRSMAVKAGLASFAFAVAAAAFGFLLFLVDFILRDSWWYSIAFNAVGMGMLAFGVSAVMTACSFLHYAAAVTGFWRAVVRHARGNASFPEFVLALNRHLEIGIGVDRKLKWWLSWGTLAGVMMALYFGASWHSNR